MTTAAGVSAALSRDGHRSNNRKAARLRYVTDREPGIARKRVGGSFTYRDAKGKAIRSAAELARIKALAVPPAWTDVWA